MSLTLADVQRIRRRSREGSTPLGMDGIPISGGPFAPPWMDELCALAMRGLRERADVVAWLNSKIDWAGETTITPQELVDGIKRGEHVGAAEKEAR